MTLTFWGIVLAVVVGHAIWDGITWVAALAFKVMGWD